MSINAVLGFCADCEGAVVFTTGPESGQRECLGCPRRGPEVILTSELHLADTDEYEIDMEVDYFHDPEQTVVGPPPREILAQARR